MGFEKGHKKVGGRVKNTPNKKTGVLADVLGAFDPAERIIALFNDTDDDSIKFGILKELMKYVYPQKKALEVTNVNDPGIQVVVVDYTSKVK